MRMATAQVTETTGTGMATRTRTESRRAVRSTPMDTTITGTVTAMRTDRTWKRLRARSALRSR